MTESRQPGIFACIFCIVIPTTVILSLRFYARRLKGLAFYYDDYLALLAYLACIAYDASVFFLMANGLGLKLADVPVSFEMAKYYQALIQEVEEHAYTVAIGASQLSLLVLFWRLFSDSMASSRIIIMILIVLVTIWTLARLLVAVFQCYPPAFFWDKTLDGACHVDPAKFFLWSVSTHLVFDAALMALPATQISRLRLPLVQKTAITAMFMFGIFVCFASIMMIVESLRYDAFNAEVMWNCTPIVEWSAVEMHLSVITCCLPILRPVLHAFGGWWARNFSSGGESGDSSNSSAMKPPVVRRLWHEGESTHELTTLETQLEPTHIYGQGSRADAIITTPHLPQDKIGDMPEQAEASHNGGIRVRYEVKLEVETISKPR